MTLGTPSVRLDQLTFEEVDGYLKDDDRLILPFGSVEQNGRHLPLGTDNLVTQAIAEMAAKDAGVLVGPGIPWRNADADLGFPGTISLPANLLNSLVEELCGALGGQGFKRLVIVTGHLNNTWTVACVAGSLRRRGVVVAQVDIWRLAAKLGADLLSSPRTFGHADELCTSIVTALASDMVRSDRLEAVDPSPGWAWDTYASYHDVWGSRPGRR